MNYRGLPDKAIKFLKNTESIAELEKLGTFDFELSKELLLYPKHNEYFAAIFSPKSLLLATAIPQVFSQWTLYRENKL